MLIHEVAKRVRLTKGAWRKACFFYGSVSFIIFIHSFMHVCVLSVRHVGVGCTGISLRNISLGLLSDFKDNFNKFE